jgi:hypothetical protein
MNPDELQAKATIASALIVSRAVELPTIPTSAHWAKDTAAMRLKALVEYVYNAITAEGGEGDG